MKAPTQQQLNDPKWWDENAPEWAQSLIEARTSADGLAWFEYGVGFGKAQWLNNGDSLTADTRPPTGWTVIAHRPAKPEPEPKERDAEPDAYMCPAGCGCLWRDNGDETMSLYGPNSRSCNICEPMRLDELVPVQKLRTQADREREEVIAEAMELTCGKDDGRDRIQRSVIRQCFEDLYEVGMLRKDNA